MSVKSASTVIRALLAGSAMLFAASAAHATTVFTAGAGSAVVSADRSANFENTAALYGNPYIEDGLSFSRTSLSFNNNGCGFAGCTYHDGFYSGATPFSGNYMYGTGSGYFEIASTGSDIFYGLEMIVGTGTGNGSLHSINWTTFLGGSTVASGTEALSAFDLPGIYGWSDSNGFDTLRFTTAAPAFDSVRVSLSPQTLPVSEPGALFAFGVGLVILGCYRRKRAA